MELIDILESTFHLNILGFTLEVDHRGHCIPGFVHIADKALDALRLIEGQGLSLPLSVICEIEGKFRIQIGCLMEAALYILCLEPQSIKYLRVRLEADLCARLPGGAETGKKPVYKLHRGLASLISVVVYETLPVDRDIQPL